MHLRQGEFSPRLLVSLFGEFLSCWACAQEGDRLLVRYGTRTAWAVISHFTARTPVRQRFDNVSCKDLTHSLQWNTYRHLTHSRNRTNGRLSRNLAEKLAPSFGDFNSLPSLATFRKKKRRTTTKRHQSRENKLNTLTHTKSWLLTKEFI